MTQGIAKYIYCYSQKVVMTKEEKGDVDISPLYSLKMTPKETLRISFFEYEFMIHNFGNKIQKERRNDTMYHQEEEQENQDKILVAEGNKGYIFIDGAKEKMNKNMKNEFFY